MPARLALLTSKKVIGGEIPRRVGSATPPRRVCLLLIGGDKTGDDQFYECMVAVADDLYDEHLETLLREGERDKGGEKGG